MCRSVGIAGLCLGIEWWIRGVNVSASTRDRGSALTSYRESKSCILPRAVWRLIPPP